MYIFMSRLFMPIISHDSASQMKECSTSTAPLIMQLLRLRSAQWLRAVPAARLSTVASPHVQGPLIGSRWAAVGLAGAGAATAALAARWHLKSVGCDEAAPAIQLVDSCPKELESGPVFELHGLVGEFQARNRRIKIRKDMEAEHAPVFQTRLWRVVRDGDAMKASDWIFREMWLDKSGNLCYSSKVADAMQVYHTQDDLAKAMVEALPEGAACKPFSFCVQVPGFQPAIFAAGTHSARELWMEELVEVIQRAREAAQQ